MRLITTKDKINNYPAAKLEKATTEDEIAAIIGNSSWTEVICNECLQVVGAVVELGCDPKIDEGTFCICHTCLQKAIELKP